ncbi:MAG: type II toxin-antitoxin system ParD family antitoxin [Gemmatimonadetes bacterium]|nr:ribbon-helix-helix domain-containing protein [Gemmatimonadota bacterium]NNL29578.1 type II toxin-antitoxin system ParD family antitoxin [Gemmatimonadota bacterium]
MVTMNVSLPESLKEFVESQVAERGYGTTSEFVRELLRRERDRMQMRALLLDGASSRPARVVDEGYWAELRERAGDESG